MSAPAGWYPVEAGSTELRWWDGTAWTDQTNRISVEAAGIITGPPTLRAPAGTNGGTVWAWLLAVSPVLSALTTIPLFFWLGQIDAADLSDPNAIIRAALSPTYFITAGLALLLYALTVVAGALDYRELRRRAVPQPFHWAWGFLEPPIVYLIGRSVVVKRRTGGGLGPLWLFIALEVVAFLFGIGVSIVIGIEASTMVSQLAHQANLG